MLTVTVSIVLALIIGATTDDWPCSKEQAIISFEEKILLNPFPPFQNDPYKNQTENSSNLINQTLHNPNIVCGLLYEDSTRNRYFLKEFPSKLEAEKAGYTVTHQGRCGVCSSTIDLSVYLSKNLTAPVRKCSLLLAFSRKVAWRCIKNLGLTDECTDIWLYSAEYTKSQCFFVCITSWIKQEPFMDEDGTLNSCLQCDEDKSGPIFKYFAGRNRRNSGIITDIQRPSDQFYNMTHCYY